MKDHRDQWVSVRGEFVYLYHSYVRTKQLIASLFFRSRGGIAPVPSNLVLIRREDDKEERRICAHINSKNFKNLIKIETE